LVNWKGTPPLPCFLEVLILKDFKSLCPEVLIPGDFKSFAPEVLILVGLKSIGMTKMRGKCAILGSVDSGKVTTAFLRSVDSGRVGRGKERVISMMCSAYTKNSSTKRTYASSVIDGLFEMNETTKTCFLLTATVSHVARGARRPPTLGLGPLLKPLLADLLVIHSAILLARSASRNVLQN
jgi:hypothetical protein